MVIDRAALSIATALHQPDVNEGKKLKKTHNILLDQACSSLRERSFHYLRGAAGRLFFSRLFFSVHVKAGFLFHTPFKARFFFSQIEGQFFLILMLGRQLFLPLCWSVDFFLQDIKAKNFFQHTGFAKLFFSAKSRARLFFQSLPPQIIKWSLPYHHFVCFPNTGC